MGTEEKTTTLTLDALKLMGSGDIKAAIDFAQTFYLTFPTKPNRPYLNNRPTATEARQYADLVEVFEKNMAEYETKRMEYGSRQKEVNAIIEEYIKNLAGFNRLPEKAKSKVWTKAWADSHHLGYTDVYYSLCDLVSLFE